ncbi:UNKNOWN [Stylonychia lemnae]|uniref:Uncharacterized protein n=1 Tax=Stylonychia lemnae TaxID=5949 RepID=A0A078A6Z8_STYLE|nr:UNKNOWN [Stylonychia lemnae]|eukprot:CDW78030.1 UNKNOWN [Stylonychia lemnae]
MRVFYLVQLFFLAFQYHPSSLQMPVRNALVIHYQQEWQTRQATHNLMQWTWMLIKIQEKMVEILSRQLLQDCQYNIVRLRQWASLEIGSSDSKRPGIQLLLVINANDGNLLMAFQENSAPESYLYQLNQINGGMLSENNQFYMVAYADSIKTSIFGVLDLSQNKSVVQAVWSYKYEGNSVQEQYTTIFVNESSQKLYVGFVQKYKQDTFTNVAKIGVIRVNSLNGQQDWSFGYQYNRVTTQDQYIQIQDIKVKTIDSKDYIGVCSNTIHGNFDIWETRVVFSLLIIDDTAQTKEMKSFEYPEYLRGRDLKIVSPTEFYVVVISSLSYDTGDPLYIFRVTDINSNGATITKTKIIFKHTFTLTDALFLDNYKVIYLASAYNYKLILRTKRYTQLLNSNDYQRSCAENNTADEVTTEFKQFSTLYQYTSFTNNLTEGNLKFISNGTLKMLDMNIETYYVPYGKFCVPKVSIIATEPTVTHYIQQGPFKLDLNQYISGDDICLDKRRNFSIRGYFEPYSIFNNTSIVLSPN